MSTSLKLKQVGKVTFTFIDFAPDATASIVRKGKDKRAEAVKKILEAICGTCDITINKNNDEATIMAHSDQPFSAKAFDQRLQTQLKLWANHKELAGTTAQFEPVTAQVEAPVEEGIAA